MKKSPLKSKTLWVNALALLGFLVQAKTGYVIAPEQQAAILAIANSVIRFDTHKSIK
jgi:hypothetical protein